MLLKPDELGLIPDSHGLRPFGYKVEFSSDRREQEYGLPYGPWTQREARIERVEIGYGADRFQASFQMWDETSVEAPLIQGIARKERMARPVNGEVVIITFYDEETGDDGRVVFKGTITGVHDRKSETGVEWMVEASSDIDRLNDMKVTFSANVRNDPIHPNPVFDGSGELVLPRLKTVKELVEDVLKFPNAWGRTSYFTADDIDWAGLDTSKRCGLFTPSDIVFNDLSRGDAIRQILEAAGNYTFIYVPSRGPARDKIRIIELNLACTRCGDPWPLKFADTDKNKIIYEMPYAYDHQVKSDLTNWTTDQTFNMCRITSGPIRFYSGHYIIPQREENPNPNPDSIDYLNKHVFPDGSDANSVVAQQKRSINQDGCFYRTDDRLIPDLRTRRQWYVGMPVFPDWNPHEDYLPAMIQLGLVRKESSEDWPKVNNITGNEKKWQGLVEWCHQTVGDLILEGHTVSRYHKHQKVYQAWFAPDECPACNGSGNVKAVYGGDNNEPVVELVCAGPNGTRVIQAAQFGTFTPRKDEVVTPRVKNYIFDPVKFGAIDPVTGEHYLPTGLAPFDPEDDSDKVVQKTGGYPLPWKNLCPYCRGVGKKPIHKIRKIGGELFTGRNNQQPDVGTGNIEIPVDPDTTVSGPESWEQAQDRMTHHEGPQVQVEQKLGFQLPAYDRRNFTFSEIERLNAEDHNSDPLFDPVQKMPHPLTFVAIRKLLPLRCKSAADQVDPNNQLSEPTWSTRCYHTTISVNVPVDYAIESEMGQIIFRESIGIECKREFKTYTQNQKNLAYDITAYGTLKNTIPRELANSNGFGTAYYRPARVWITCFYSRDNWYTVLQEDLDGNEIETREIIYKNDDDVVETYQIRCMVIDGRFAMEIQKKNPDSEEEGETEFGTGNRALQVAISDESISVDTFYPDLFTYPVPTHPDFSQKQLEWEKLGLPTDENDPPTPEELQEGEDDRTCEFARGRLLKWESSTPGEVQMEIDGYSNEDYLTNPERYKLFSWRLRDQRPRMLQLGIKKLEASNNMQVSGTLIAGGVMCDTSKGLGWVDYPDRGPATVRRVSYDLTNGFTTTLELSRERARIGELPPSADEEQNQVLKELARLQRAVFLSDGTVKPILSDREPRTSGGPKKRDNGQQRGTQGQNVLFY